MARVGKHSGSSPCATVPALNSFTADVTIPSGTSARNYYLALSVPYLVGVSDPLLVLFLWTGKWLTRGFALLGQASGTVGFNHFNSSITIT
jgi:hypothetical protein